MLAMWTPGLILEVLAFFGIVSLVLFGITLIAVGGFYFVRVVGAYLGRKRDSALQERASAAMQAGNLAWMAVVCGPLLGFFGGLISTLPAVMIERRMGFLWHVEMLFLITGLGALAGIIAGGAFWASSAALGRVRKTVKRLARGGVWDPDLDGLAQVALGLRSTTGRNP